MTHEEFAKKIHEIDPSLTADSSNNIFIEADNHWKYIIYDSRCDQYDIEPIITYIPEEFDAIVNLIDEFKGRYKQ